jgi:rubrerythrin
VNAARLFRAVAFAEEVHAINHLRELGEIGSTDDNLSEAINGEKFEVDEMYPAYMAVAELQEEKGARKSMLFAYEVEKVHSRLYAEAKAAIQAGQDAAMDLVMVCPFCGYTHLGGAPDKCPVCGAAGRTFRQF